MDQHPATVENYPLIDTSLPSIPSRSRLHSLEPVGVGTPYVESLISYICNLANAHSLSIGVFYEFIITPSLGKSYFVTPSHLSPANILTGPFKHYLKTINGKGTLAQEFVEALETLTLRNDLRYLTLTTLANVITNWNLLRKFPAWCPNCYEEMRQSKQVIYQPLMWSLAVVEMCDRHMKRLVDRCPYCHQQLPQITRRHQLGYCPKCGCWLGQQTDSSDSKGTQLTEKEFNWQKFVTDNVKKLLAVMPKLNANMRSEVIPESLRVCVDRTTGGNNSQFATLIGKPLVTFYGWSSGKIRAPLPELLRICYCLNLSLLDLLSGADDLKSRIEWQVRKPTDIPDVIIVFRRHKQFNRSKAKDDLKKLLKLTPPISMAEAARRLKRNGRDLYRIAPELCYRISAKYKSRQKRIYEVGRKKREQEVVRAIRKIQAQGFYPTLRLVAEFLNRPSYMHRRDVASILKKTRVV